MQNRRLLCLLVVLFAAFLAISTQPSFAEDDGALPVTGDEAIQDVQELDAAPTAEEFENSVTLPGAESSVRLGRVGARRGGNPAPRVASRLRAMLIESDAGSEINACVAEHCGNGCNGAIVIVGRCRPGQGCQSNVARNLTGSAPLATCVHDKIGGDMTAL